MSIRRWSFIIVLGIVSSAWALSALYVQSIRQQHGYLIEAIREETAPIALTDIDAAIADYRHALGILPCNAALHQELNIIIAQRTDDMLNSGDVGKASDALDDMSEALSDTLACTPTDGKAWLDFAVISIHREGLTNRALGAYAMSAHVAPGESWLAEKRLYFALTFLPLLDEKARRIAQSDIAVLEHGHPNRIQSVIEAANVTSAKALKKLFHG